MNFDEPTGALALPRPGLRGRLAGLSVESFLWAVGVFCAFNGAFLLVAPHHFQTPPYRGLQPYAAVWAALALFSGMGLLAAAVVRPGRRARLAIHAFAGLTLFALSASFGRVGALTGMFAYAVFGAAAVAATALPRGRSGAEGDLFSLVLSVGSAVSGLLMATFPERFTNPFYGPNRHHIPVLGLALLAAGLWLAWTQVSPPRRRWLGLAAHVCTGTVYFTFGYLISVPGRVWTGIVLYCAGGIVVALLPWLRPWLARLDTAALRSRFALALAVAASLGLILATAVVTAQEERLAEEQVEAVQRIEARAIAQNVSDYLELNAARTSAVAALAGRVPMAPPEQGAVLRGADQSYQDVAAFRTLDAEGQVVVGLGDLAVGAATLRSLLVDDPRVQLATVELKEGRSLLLLGAPIYGAPGRRTGLLVVAYEFRELVRRLSRPGSVVALGDGHGRTLALRDLVPPEVERLPPLPDGWDAAVLAGRRLAREGGVLGTAEVPNAGWAVAVERPRAAALAGVRRGRDLAFLLLLAVAPVAITCGIVVAGRIARPLRVLSEAAAELTAGNPDAPLPAASKITEVATLSTAFRDMRSRLAARTRESERLAAELRARAEALAEADRRKDEFLAMLAHELRNPLGAIANASYLLEQAGPEDPALARPVAVIRRQIQHLVRMVDDLLDVSRITRGKIELRRVPIDLGEVVRHAVDVTRPLAEAKAQRLEFAPPPEPLPLVGDATRLEQVFSNLLRNAVKFTGDGGTIEVAAARDGHGEAVVRVRDDGIGIPAELLPRVFELFAQGEQALDRSEAGLGIGLTLVRSLVDLHGGRVRAASDGEGQGSEFEVRLPLSDPADRAS